MKKQYVLLRKDANSRPAIRIFTGTDKLAFENKCADKGISVQWVKGSPPTYTTLEKYTENGIAKATDGCKIEPDGTCQHGHDSWLIVLGLI